MVVVVVVVVVVVPRRPTLDMQLSDAWAVFGSVFSQREVFVRGGRGGWG